MKWFRGRSVNVDMRRIIGILAAVGIAAVILLVLTACASVGTISPSEVFRAQHADGSPVALRIFTTQPCENEQVLSYLKYKFGIPQEVLVQFKASVLTWQGRDWASCWIEQQGWVLSVDEEGAQFDPVRKSMMRQEGV